MNKKSIILIITALFSFSGVVSAEYVIQFNNSQSKGMIPETTIQTTYSSCKEILDNGQSTGSGVYPITVNNKEFDVYCDMTSAGGGWTMVVAQFEQDPVTNWNEGIQADYDPSLATNKGFALNLQEIPNHTQTAFGKSLDSTFIGYSNFIYSTGDIQKTLLQNLKTNEDYHIYRNKADYHYYGDPEDIKGVNTLWNNQLTYDKTGGRMYNWTFYPNGDPVSYRGYNINGMHLLNSEELFSWTVWVR